MEHSLGSCITNYPQNTVAYNNNHFLTSCEFVHLQCSDGWLFCSTCHLPGSLNSIQLVVGLVWKNQDNFINLCVFLERGCSMFQETQADIPPIPYSSNLVVFLFYKTSIIKYLPPYNEFSTVYTEVHGPRERIEMILVEIFSVLWTLQWPRNSFNKGFVSPADRSTDHRHPLAVSSFRAKLICKSQFTNSNGDGSTWKQ